jgi:hypothetical protein
MLLLCLAAADARGDVLPPGHKWADHRVRFENLAAYSDYAFFLYPRDLPRGNPGNSSVRVPAEGECGLGGNPLARSMAGGVFLYAVPRRLFANPDDPPKEEWFERPADGVLKSDPLVDDIRTVPETESRTRFRTVYRVTIADGKLVLDLVSHDTPGTSGGPTAGPERRYLVIGLAAAAVVIAAGWLVARRWRGRQAHA